MSVLVSIRSLKRNKDNAQESRLLRGYPDFYRLVAGAGKDRKLRVLREIRIGLGEDAKEELAPAGIRYRSYELALRTQTRIALHRFLAHNGRASLVCSPIFRRCLRWCGRSEA